MNLKNFRVVIKTWKETALPYKNYLGPLMRYSRGVSRLSSIFFKFKAGVLKFPVFQGCRNEPRLDREFVASAKYELASSNLHANEAVIAVNGHSSLTKRKCLHLRGLVESDTDCSTLSQRSDVFPVICQIMAQSSGKYFAVYFVYDKWIQ